MLFGSFILDINATSVTEMIFSQTIIEKDGVWPILRGSEKVVKLDIVYQEHLVLEQKSLEENIKLK